MSYGNYPDLTHIKKILVIKLRHHGDVLLSSPVFTTLKARFPEAEIDALIYKETLPMLSSLPAISHFLLYDASWKKLSFLKRLKQEWTLFRTIYNQKYDLVLNLTEGDRGALAAFFSKARIKVGFDPEKKGFLGKKSIYTHVVKNCKTPRHTVEKNLDALRKIGIDLTLKERELSFVVKDESREKIKRVTAGEDFILMHPTSRWKFKCYPPHLIAELITQLEARRFNIVLTSGPEKSEMAMIKDILEKCPHTKVTDLSGKISLEELGALIELAQGVICVDSVPLHLASALKTPVIALFGPSSDKEWGPWMHPKGYVVSHNIPCRPCGLDGCGGSKISDCMHQIPVADVLRYVASFREIMTLAKKEH